MFFALPDHLHTSSVATLSLSLLRRGLCEKLIDPSWRGLLKEIPSLWDPKCVTCWHF